MTARIETRARTERKDASLPRYLVLPPEAAEALALNATTPAHFVIDGTDIGRRNIKRWSPGSDLWFVDLTEAQCRKAGVETGDQVALAVARLADELPEEFKVLLTADEKASAAWAELTSAAPTRVG